MMTMEPMTEKVAEISTDKLESIELDDSEEQSVPTLHVESDTGFDRQIEDELDRINNAIAEINRLSGDLFAARTKLKNMLLTSKHKLGRIYRVNRKHVEKARPYFKAKQEAAKVKGEFVQASMDYRKASLEFEDAKENAAVAEKALLCNTLAVVGLSEEDEPDVLINLNKANDRVSQWSQEKSRAGEAKRTKTVQMTALEERMKHIHKEAGTRTVDKAASYFELRDTMERDLQKLLQDVKMQQRLLQDAKDKYRSAFANLDVISAELEQRQCAIDVNNTRDLSKFEEIEDIEEALDTQHPQRAQSMESILSTRSADSFKSEASLKAHNEHGRPLSSTISLDEVVVHEVTSDPWHQDPREQLENYAVSFQMEV